MSAPKETRNNQAGRAPGRIAVVVTAVIALIGGGIVISLARRHSSPPPKRSSSSLPSGSPTKQAPISWIALPHETIDAIWPEQTTEDAEAAQVKADGGDTDFTWQTESAEVAKRF